MAIKLISSIFIPLLIILSISSLLVCDVKGTGHGPHHNVAEASNTEHHDELEFHHIGTRSMQVVGNTFFLEDDTFGDIQAKKVFTLPEENKINYFELVLEAKGNKPSPFSIELSSTLQFKSFDFDGPTDAKANDIFGFGLYNHKGKFYVFYTKKSQGKEDILKDDELYETDVIQIRKQKGGGIFPRITLKGLGTKVKMQKGHPTNAEKLNQKIQATKAGSSHVHGHGHGNVPIKDEDNVDKEEMMAHKIVDSMWH